MTPPDGFGADRTKQVVQTRFTKLAGMVVGWHGLGFSVRF